MDGKEYSTNFLIFGSGAIEKIPAVVAGPSIEEVKIDDEAKQRVSNEWEMAKAVRRQWQ